MKLGEIVQPLIELLKDAEHAERLLAQDDGQFYRRSYLRSTFAAIEGIVWLLKQTCYKVTGEAGAPLSVAEHAMLSEETYDLKRNGEVRTQPKFLRLPDNLKFTINTCNRFLGSTIDLEIETTPWHQFLNAIKIRNRIMHPKEASELQISDQEIADCQQVVGWFNEKIHQYIIELTKPDRSGSVRHRLSE